MKTMKKMCIVAFAALLLLCSTTFVYSLWVANSTECVFEGQCEDPINWQSIPKDGVISDVSLVGVLIRDAAIKFLDSSSDFQKFLQFSEYSGITTPSLYFEFAKAKMIKARNAYTDLFNTVNKLEYDQSIIILLNGFDYDKFAIEKRLNISTFEAVKEFYQRGDIKGAFKYLADKSDEIYQKLNNFNGDISEIWRILQTYSEFQLFGQYMTEVIMEVKQK